MSSEKERAGQGILASQPCTVARCLVSVATFSLLCLALAFPVRASAHTNAHTSLLRTAPTNGALLSAAPAQVRLWFSAVVDARFSTAMVEDEGHAYVNTRDASLSPADAREMEVPLPPHLPPGVYTVLWRAVSDSDGLVLGGASRFTIVQPGQSLPQQSGHPVRPLLDQFDGLVLALVAVRLLLVLLRAATAAHNERRVTRQPTSQRPAWGAADLKQHQSLRLAQRRCWESLVGVVIVLCLGLEVLAGGPGIFSSASTPPAPGPALPQDTLAALMVFHAAVSTTDSRFMR